MTGHHPYDIDANSIPIDQLPTPPAAPAVDHDSRLLLDRLVTALTDLRFPLWHHDAAAKLHILASLHADINARMPAAIADARDQDYTWNHIATSLGISAARARHQTRRRACET